MAYFWIGRSINVSIIIIIIFMAALISLTAVLEDIHSSLIRGGGVSVTNGDHVCQLDQ